MNLGVSTSGGEGVRESSLPGPWGNNWTGGSPRSVVVCCLDSGVTDLDDFVSHTPRHPCNRSSMVMGLKGNIAVGVGHFAMDTGVQLDVTSGHMYIEEH